MDPNDKDMNQDVDLEHQEHQEDGDKQSPQLSEEETIAMARGWKPKEEWDGDEKDWKPAKVFNEIGELKEKISNSEKELKKSNKVIQLMKEHHLKVKASAYKEALEQLKAERAKALKEQDFAKAEEIRDEIDEVKEKFQEKGEEPNVEHNVVTPDPAYEKFLSKNAWYKPNGNEMSRKADAIGWAYRQSDPDMPLSEILEKVEKDIKKMYPEKFEAPRNPVNESGTRGSEGTKGKVKLSDDEKAVARSFGMTDEEYAKELTSYKGR